MLKKNSPGRINARRINALERLENPKKALVEDKDKVRVASEKEILKSRILAEVEARGILTKKDRTKNVQGND